MYCTHCLTDRSDIIVMSMYLTLIRYRTVDNLSHSIVADTSANAQIEANLYKKTR
jgi:hypothetical protein